MANYTAADVKALRDKTGAGMLDCKKALDEAEGNVERALEILRLKGAKSNAKRADRTTSEGVVVVKENGNGTATVLELACETDFVAKGEKFVALANRVLEAVAAADADSVESALAVSAEGKTVGEVISEEAAILGEKVELRTLKLVKGENFSIYLHQTSKDLPPQLAVVVGYSGNNAEVAHSVAQHIAFAQPKYLTRDEVPADDVAKERHIVEEQTAAEGKPENVVAKIVEGRLNAFFKEIVLPEQEFAMDNKKTIAQVLKDAGLEVSGFAFVKVGA